MPQGTSKEGSDVTREELVNVFEAVGTISSVLIGVIRALEEIRDGDPSKVDLAALKQRLLSLPDLPTAPLEEGGE